MQLSWFVLPLRERFSLFSRWDDSLDKVEAIPDKWLELLLTVAAEAALANEPAADNAKSPAAAELEGGIPAADKAAAAEGGCRPASAGCGIIGNGGPWECADGNCCACICCLFHREE